MVRKRYVFIPAGPANGGLHPIHALLALLKSKCHPGSKGEGNLGTSRAGHLFGYGMISVLAGVFSIHTSARCKVEGLSANIAVACGGFLSVGIRHGPFISGERFGLTRPT